MKVAIIYFSLEGNTKYVAEKIAEKLDGDIIRLMPLKEYPTGKVSKFFWGGKSSAFRESPVLEEYDFNSEKYDVVILGTPIWAGTFAPPLRTFLKENKLINKKVAFFACCSGGSTEKCFQQFEKGITDSTVLSTLKLIDPFKNNKAEDDESINNFCEQVKINFEK